MDNETQEAIPSGEEMMKLFLRVLVKRLYDDLSADGAAVSSADLAIINRLLENNNVTIASVKAGNFGKYAQKVAEQFPFDGQDQDRLQ